MLKKKDDRVFVAGHLGMVGSALVRRLRAEGYRQIITEGRAELDLSEQSSVREFFCRVKPQYVILAAAKVGGIHANNTYPADFIYINLQIQCNVIHEAYRAGVDGLLFLGSSCIYPKYADQPIKEEALLSGPLEPTNEPYAIAKIAGIKLCESYARQHSCDFRSVMPTNLYGPQDNYHPTNSHVIPALIRRFHEAKLTNADSVTIWGSGRAKREFLHVDDMADACLTVMEASRERYAALTEPMLSQINVGTGEDISIAELAETVKRITGFSGRLEFDRNYPDGTARKVLDISKISSLGWKPRYSLDEGIADAYGWYRENIDLVRC